MEERQVAKIKELLKAFQADNKYLAIAIYAIEGNCAVRIAEAGETCGQCVRVDLSAGNIGLVARTRKVHVSQDVSSDRFYKSCFTEVKSEIAAPILCSGQVVGIIDAETDVSRPLTATDELEIIALTRQLAVQFESRPRRYE